MALRVVNPERPLRSSPRPPTVVPSRSSSSSSDEPPQIPILPADRISLRSFISSSDHSTFSERKFSLEEEDKPPRYIDDRTGFVQEKSEKSLPAIPSEKEQYRRPDDYDPYAVENTGSSLHWSRPFISRPSADPRHPSSSTHTNIHPLTTASQLADALGPENAPHSTEIDTIPCAGVRIPHGPLTGLLAWRLVVRKPPPTKGKRGWWSDTSSAAAKQNRRSSYTVPYPPPPPIHAFSYSEPDTQMAQQPLTSVSTVSLPLLHARTLSSTPERVNATLVPESSRPQSVALSRQPHIPPSHSSSTDAVAANFILDTSLPYSIISRDTLMTLGYPSYRFPSPATSNPHSLPWEEDEDSNAVVTLSIQNIPTRLRIARPEEASRLGVQFLQDAGVSVFFPRDGGGLGPVLYLESARLLKDVPRTITSLPAGGRPKMTLPQRVRALFGLT